MRRAGGLPNSFAQECLQVQENVKAGKRKRDTGDSSSCPGPILYGDFDVESKVCCRLTCGRPLQYSFQRCFKAAPNRGFQANIEERQRREEVTRQDM